MCLASVCSSEWQPVGLPKDELDIGWCRAVGVRQEEPGSRRAKDANRLIAIVIPVPGDDPIGRSPVEELELSRAGLEIVAEVYQARGLPVHCDRRCAVAIEIA